jgi:hypothetical protein
METSSRIFHRPRDCQLPGGREHSCVVLRRSHRWQAARRCQVRPHGAWHDCLYHCVVSCHRRAGLEQVTPIDALVNYSRPYSGSLASPQRAMFSQPSQSRALQDSVRSDYDRHVPGSRRAMTVYMPFLSIFRASVHLPCLVVCHRNVHGIRCRLCALCS